MGGGVFTSQDKEHFLSLGADGVQVGTRFIATEECDAITQQPQNIVYPRL
ncbi:nitronate monooxygenase [Clostridium transplantifaecale]|nr:nitronate monooxygenase [Clostridium transplantifaecale]